MYPSVFPTCRWTRATIFFTRTVVYTDMDARCDKLVKVVRRTSTVASIVNLVRPTTVASTFVELS